jgi:hypothetical protein
MDAIAGAVVDSRFADTSANGADVTSISESETPYARVDTGLRLTIPQVREPDLEGVRLENPD